MNRSVSCTVMPELADNFKKFRTSSFTSTAIIFGTKNEDNCTNIARDHDMKRLIIYTCCICFFIGCSKKSVPSKTVTPTSDTVSVNNNNNNIGVITDSLAADSAFVLPAATVMVIADGYGRLITPQQSLPQDAAIKYNNLQLSKGFTTQQRANLQARYKTIPPRVLYVPPQYSLTSLKGSYYIYRKKFWYWKKSDGLYYLDQKYYF